MNTTITTPANVSNTSESILFKPNSVSLKESEPDYFRDLNLDQIVNDMVAGREEYNLKPFFYTSLRSVDDIKYRHDVMRDLTGGAILGLIKLFENDMLKARECLSAAKTAPYPLFKEKWHLDAAILYCQAVQNFDEALAKNPPASEALQLFVRSLRTYLSSPQFSAFFNAMRSVSAQLGSLSYSLLVKSNSVTVSDADASDNGEYTSRVEKLFSRFGKDETKVYGLQLSPVSGMSHVEAQILERVAKLNPEAFAALSSFNSKYVNFIDEKIARFEREIQFYVCYLHYLSDCKRAGLPFCFPKISDSDKEIKVTGSFDFSLAGKLLKLGEKVVCNDFELNGKERVFVVTGPNQGGKTTFARMFGQIHHIASLGLPVPGRHAQLFLMDRIFTHFEREEKITALEGKLKDDLVRIHHILSLATPQSVIITNEIFSSTSLADGKVLGGKIMQHIWNLDCISVFVTFLDELAATGGKNVSMIATIDEIDSTRRTFSIKRGEPNGLAYALALAKKHGLSEEQLSLRIKK